MNAHLPLRPSWDCAACGQPWPCQPARERMAAEADTSLRIAAWSWLEEAMRDMPDAPAGELWQRFIGWTRNDEHSAKDEVAGQVSQDEGDGSVHGER